MKKILSLLLAVCFALSFVSGISVSAEKEYKLKMNEELLTNGGFEDGDETGFVSYGNSCEVEVSEEYAHTGEYGFGIFNRTQKYANWAYNIKDILSEAGPGQYKASVWVRLADDSEFGGDVQLVLNLKTEKSENPKYITSSKIALTKEWQQLTFDKKVDYNVDDVVTSAFLYQQSFDKSDNAPDVLVDDFSLIKTTEINGIMPEEKLELEKVKLEHISVAGVAREEKTTFGAIRWDAWYTHDGNDSSVITQVERSLSPKQFHWRAPFYAKVTDEGNIIIPSYTQEVFDKEMEYAIEAGVDYFAYVWYSSDMKASRIFHTQSKYKNDVKMCACFDGNAINKEYARKEMETLFLEDYYMTVLGGRPLMYYFGTNDNLQAISKDIEYYRSLTKTLGIPEPYAVIMNVNPQQALSAYGDAVSSYAVSGKNNEPFKDLAQKAVNEWLGYQSSGMQYVPTVSFGWQPEPRFHNPVSWTQVSDGSWADYAKAEELTEHLTYAYSYMQHSYVKEFTKANTMIAYAWNEHDEGGWMCPTIAVDEDGKQIFNEDGTPKINDERVKAVKIAVENYKNGNFQEVTINGVTSNGKAPEQSHTPENSSAPELTPAPQKDDDGFGLWWIIPVAAVVVIGAVVLVIVLKKKEK